MAANGQIERSAQELFGVGAGVIVPRLILELKAPHRVAATLGVAPNAVRKWLVSRGWVFNGEQWVAPQVEAEHAPAV